MIDESSLVCGLKAFLPEPTTLIEIAWEQPRLLGPYVANPVARRAVVEVTWVRECAAAVTFSHGGRLLHQDGIHHDYYGFMSSQGSVVEDFEKQKQRFAITSESSLEMSIRMVLIDRPTLGFVKHGFGKTDLFRPVPDGVWLAQDIADDEDFVSLPWERRNKLSPVVHSVADVWSSKRSAHENEKALQHFRTIANAETRITGEVVSRGYLNDGTYVFGDVL